jgi:carbon storage regulator CsrA
VTGIDMEDAQRRERRQEALLRAALGQEEGTAMLRIEDRSGGDSMLVLSRKAMQGVRLLMPDGRVITLRVLEAQGGKVRLGIDAPQDIEVSREELLPRQVPPGTSPGGVRE